MEQRHIGYFLVGISVILLVITLLFKQSLAEYIYAACPIAHGPDPASCPATKTLNQQSYLSYALIAIIVLVGIMLITVKPEQRIVIKNKLKKSAYHDESNLSKEEKIVLYTIQKEKAIFQGDLIERTAFSKAKITRILDKLENRSVIERKRRGLTNIVVLKTPN